MKLPRVSVAVALYNEEAVLAELLRRIGAVLSTLPGGPHQLVLVDDGSSDRTLGMAEEACKADPRVVVIALTRNFGHQAALTAALDHAEGDVVVVMDADLQDPPEAIPTFLMRYQEGYDVVYAMRVGRKEGWALRLSYWAYYRMVAKLSTIALPVDAGDFGLLSRRVVQELRRAPERHRYLRGLRTWVGFRQVGVPVERAERASGQSKYDLGRLLRLAGDGLFAFSTAPLRAAALVGAAAVGAATLFACYSLFAKLFLGHVPRGFTALIVVVTFLAGVQLLFLGILGEYVGRVYEEVKARPIYIVDRVTSGSAGSAS